MKGIVAALIDTQAWDQQQYNMTLPYKIWLNVI